MTTRGSDKDGTREPQSREVTVVLLRHTPSTLGGVSVGGGVPPPVPPVVSDIVLL
ncbi:MAG TPA: hypothetical protein VFW45_06680 [Candidatus Polarisedimenticolia bacterium]|nr:hypothetical protein [Candidatus Polarisedimenticolia bacterium]